MFAQNKYSPSTGLLTDSDTFLNYLKQRISMYHFKYKLCTFVRKPIPKSEKVGVTLQPIVMNL